MGAVAEESIHIWWLGGLEFCFGGVSLKNVL
jgi:hypothetical protein